MASSYSGSVRRKGKVIASSQVTTDGPLTPEIMRIVEEDIKRQTKADFDKRHTGRKTFRRKKPSA